MRAGHAVALGPALLGLALLGPVLRNGAARAQSGLAGPVQCSKFLHNADGSWSSFWNGDVLGSYGPVAIHPGERFRRGGDRRRDDLARILDGLCGDD